MPAKAFSEAVEAMRRDRIQELQIRELEASQELHKVCAAIGVQSGGILAVAAMASTLAKASAARMVAERLGVLSVPKGRAA